MTHLALILLMHLCCQGRVATARGFYTNKLHRVQWPPSSGLATAAHSAARSDIGGHPSLIKTPSGAGGSPCLIKTHRTGGNASSELQSRASSAAPSSSALSRRLATGALLAAGVSPLCFAEKHVFSLALMLPIMQALREFHVLIQNTHGHDSAGLFVGVLSAMATCHFASQDASLHPFVPPLSILAFMLQNLFFRKDIIPTASLTASVFGSLYISYLTSFWIRLLDIHTVEFTALPMMTWGPLSISSRSFLLWWTLSIIAAADIGGFAVGKLFGSRPVSQLGVAVGRASPGKTLEGLLGGVIFAVYATLLGVWYMRPIIHTQSSKVIALGYVFSFLYGSLLALLSYSSDVSVSLFKRNAGVKDSGGLLPGHGGVLDRMDSYILTAPAVCLFWLLWGRA